MISSASSKASRLLGQGIDGAGLVAAGDAHVGAAARHLIQHGDVLGHPDGIGGGQHDAQLADAHALGLHGRVEVPEHGIGRALEPLDVEVVLGEADALVAEVVGQAHDVAHLAERALVQVRILPRHAAAELGRLADGREHEEVEFHRPGV
jgi:hypothetical protein